LLASGDLAAPGLVYRLEKTEAAYHVAGGRAHYDSVRIRAAYESALINGIVCRNGDELECTEQQAVAAVNRGAAVLVNPAELRDPSKLRPPPPVRKPPPPVDPWASVAFVKVRALRPVNSPVRGLSVGEEAEVPEPWACHASSLGAVEILGLSGLTDRARRFLESLRNPSAGRTPDSYDSY
jgi:hypothetical protein